MGPDTVAEIRNNADVIDRFIQSGRDSLVQPVFAVSPLKSAPLFPTTYADLTAEMDTSSLLGAGSDIYEIQPFCDEGVDLGSFPMPPLEDATPVDFVEDAFSSDSHISGSSSSSDSDSVMLQKKATGRPLGDESVERLCSRFLSLVSSTAATTTTTTSSSSSPVAEMNSLDEDEKDVPLTGVSDELKISTLRPLVRSLFSPDLSAALLSHITSTKQANDVSVAVLLSESTETLSLRGCTHITDNCLDSIAAYAPRLRALDLSDCSGLSADRVSLLLHSSLSRTLEELHLNGSSWVADTSIPHIFGAVLPSLRVLSLRRCIKLRDTGVAALPALCPALLHIDLSSCGRVSSNGIRRLAQKLASRSRSRTEDSAMSVRLRRCGGVDDAAVTGIASSLGDDLEHLDVSHCEDVTDAGVTALAAQCGGLRRLNLRGCFRVSDAGMEAFASNESAPRRTLESLSLDGCDVGDDSIELLVARCPKLRQISVVDCPRITQERMTRLVQCTGAEILL